MSLSVVVLAAGQGTRMKSDLPKVMHPIAGRSMISRVVDTALAVGGVRVFIVYGHGGDQLVTHLAPFGSQIELILQAEQLGTGHALAQAVPSLPAQGKTLVLFGDVPFIETASLQTLVSACDEHTMSILTCRLNNPTGYGRVLRDDAGCVQRTVEERDASDQQRKISEVYAGPMVLPNSFLKQYIHQLSNNNQQREYYLPDLIGIAVNAKVKVETHCVDDVNEVKGINSRQQLAELERWYQHKQASSLMNAGATIVDPSRFDCRGTVTLGRDVVIDVNVVFEGRVVLGDRVVIEPNCILKDCQIGADSTVRAFSHLEGASLETFCTVGPYARLRPGTVIQSHAKVGNFVEIKKATLGEGSKVNHLSYVGDAFIGADANLGAGVITCNYDGKKKSETHIGERAFVGSNCALVAPISIGDDAFVAAGSTITRHAPAGKLTIARQRQTVVDHWVPPTERDA